MSDDQMIDLLTGSIGDEGNILLPTTDARDDPERPDTPPPTERIEDLLFFLPDEVCTSSTESKATDKSKDCEQNHDLMTMTPGEVTPNWASCAPGPSRPTFSATSSVGSVELTGTPPQIPPTTPAMVTSSHSAPVTVKIHQEIHGAPASSGNWWSRKTLAWGLGFLLGASWLLMLYIVFQGNTTLTPRPETVPTPEPECQADPDPVEQNNGTDANYDTGNQGESADHKAEQQREQGLEFMDLVTTINVVSRVADFLLNDVNLLKVFR